VPPRSILVPAMEFNEEELERRINDVTDYVCLWIRVWERRRIEVLFVYLPGCEKVPAKVLRTRTCSNRSSMVGEMLTHRLLSRARAGAVTKSEALVTNALKISRSTASRCNDVISVSTSWSSSSISEGTNVLREVLNSPLALCWMIETIRRVGRRSPVAIGPFPSSVFRNATDAIRMSMGAGI